MLVAVRQTAAFVLAGQWVAACGQPGCNGYEGVPVPGDDNRQGMGRLVTVGQPVFQCSNCGTANKVDWPDAPDDIMGVLAKRIVPDTRNWFTSETLADLEAENRMHPEGVR